MARSSATAILRPAALVRSLPLVVVVVNRVLMVVLVWFGQFAAMMDRR
jgi:hypothetical protein